MHIQEDTEEGVFIGQIYNYHVDQIQCTIYSKEILDYYNVVHVEERMLY